MSYVRRVVLCVGALVAWAAVVACHPSHGASSGDVLRGKHMAEAECASCHGADGNSTIAQFPKLAGQHRGYLYLQLRAFQTGTRPSATMSGYAKRLSDREMSDLATYYSRQTIRPDPIRNRRLAEEGKRVFFGPIGGGPMSCATCHSSIGRPGGGRRTPVRGMMGGMGGGTTGMGGMMGMGRKGGMGGMMEMGGMMANVPSLAGQHAIYVVAQLDAFASGRRYSMMMNSVASSLTEAQRKAVAEYVSGLK